MNPDERYTLKMKLGKQFFETHNNGILKVAGEPGKAEWKENDFNDMYINVADEILERYSVSEGSSYYVAFSEKLGREMWKIFDDRLERFLHPNQKPRPTPPWKGDKLQLVWVDVAKQFLEQYKVAKK